MVRILAIAAAALGIGLSVAQVAPGIGRYRNPVLGSRMQRRQAIRQRMASRLRLTEAQKTQLKSIRENTREQLKAIRESKVTQDVKREQARKLLTNARSQMRSVLTPEQRLKVQSHGLGLSDAQRGQIKSIREHARQQLKAVHESKATQDVKREQAKKVLADAREQMKSVLTPEQQKKAEGLRARLGVMRSHRTGKGIDR